MNREITESDHQSSATPDENLLVKKDILNFPRLELEEELSSALGLERFRAEQLTRWIYRERMTSFHDMTNVSKAVRDKLESTYHVSRPKLGTVQVSKDGTRKYLFELADGSKIESVLIKQEKRSTLCVSSQVGCAIGCKFCRTALMGLKRNLQTSEIVGQVLAVQDDVADCNKTLPPEEQISDFSNIVFMGMGEPLHNLKNVDAAVRILNDTLGFDFSQRKITVSTSGLVPAIKKFGESEALANLAVSLNATTDEVRSRIIPINKKWPLDSLLGTLREYPLKRRQRITMEYVMLGGVNDTDADLARLPGLLRGIPSKVNLIPYNENAGLGWKAPDLQTITRWQKTLLSKGVSSSIRWSKGMDIDAACGQLATEKQKEAH